MQLLDKILQIGKQNIWLRKWLRRILLSVLVLVTFFYAFFFSLSEQKIKNFVVNSFSTQQKITIGSIKKHWCSIEIQQFQLEKIIVPKIQIRFCSFSFLFLQAIPVQLSFEAGEILANFPIFANQGVVNISSDFAWNKLPIVSDYVPVRGNPFYNFAMKYNIKQELSIAIDFVAKDFILNQEKIQPVFIQGFIPKQVKFDDLLLQIDILEKRMNITMESKGFFQGKIIGIVSRNVNFFQSKISFKISGQFQDASKLSPLIQGYLQPYLKKNSLKVKLEGKLIQPRLTEL